VPQEHPLSDDTGVAIFTKSVLKEISTLDKMKSEQALTAIINCLRSAVPESVIEKSYETCAELQQLRQGDLRIYVTLITHIEGYDVLWVFAIKKHRYRNLGKFDAQACAKVNQLRRMTADTVEEYLDSNNALTVSELIELRASL
jgi:hypothetical protein